MKKGKYGYIEFVDKRKLKHDGWDDQIEPEIRKPSPAEREEILINYIRDNSGKRISIRKLSNLLAVSHRTIQKHLKHFEDKGLIRRINQFGTGNYQIENILEYVGPDTPRAESDLTIQKLYDPDNPCGIRDWDWADYKFIPGYYTPDFTKKDAQNQSEDLKKKKQAIVKKKEALKSKKCE